MAATVTNGTYQNTSNNLTMARPSGTAAGDLLLAFVASDGTGVSLSAPGGWVDLGGKNDVQRSMRAFYKIATNSEAASYTFSSNSGNSVRAAILLIEGAPTSNPIAVNPSWNAGTGNTLTINSQTSPTAGGGLQVVFMTANAGSDFTISGPSGFNTLTQPAESNRAHMAWRNVTGQGSVPSTTASASGLYGWGTGTMLVASGSVLSIDRYITPAHTNVRSVIKNLGGAVTPAGVASLTRVVVKLIARTLGGGSITTDGITDPFSDSFSIAAGAPGPTLSRTFLKTPVKTLGRSILTYGGYANVTQKLITGTISIIGFSRRTAVRRFTASIAPTANLTAFNIGRLFGTPGVIDITVRLAGEVRARVRRR